jgi:LPXTG-site transpeptidase (sortase) family protein
VGNLEGRRWHLGTGRSWLLEVGIALVTLGFVVLLFVAYELVGTNLTEEHSQARLAREFKATVGQPTVARPHRSGGDVPTIVAPVVTISPPAGAPQRMLEVGGVPLPVPPPGGALDHLVIPVIGVSRYVVQGVSDSDLQMGPGHYPGTPLPGQPGNVAIAGHRTTFGAPFFRLNEVSRGDLIYLTDTAGTTWVYGVEHLWVVVPTDTAVLAPTRQAELTLTTCNPRFEALSRLVIRATLLRRFPRGTHMPGRLAVAESAGGGVPGIISPPATTSAAGKYTTTLPGRRSAEPSGPGHAETAHAETGVGHTGGQNTSVQKGNSPEAPAAGASNGTRASNGNGAAKGDGATWAATIGWAALALLAWVITRIGAAHLRRYSKVLMLTFGALVSLVPLWFAFGNLVDLLPASI